MSLTGPLLLALISLVLAAGIAVLVLRADRLPGRAWARALQRLGLVLAVQVLAVALVFVAVNDQQSFFTSWSDLLGTGAAGAAAPITDPGGVLRQRVGEADRLSAAVSGTAADTGDRASRGLLVTTEIRGAKSGLSDSLTAYLPPQYFQPAYAHVRFPVLELFDGHPGSPTTWTRSLHVDQLLRDGVAQHRSLPFVLLMPDVNVAGREDTDCQNVVNGPPVDTLLGVDVPALARIAVRVRADRAGWGTAGYSEGGYCAVIEAQRHPDTFGAAAGMSGGYGTDYLSSGPLAIYGNSRRVRLEASPTWRMANRPVAPVSYLVTASEQETDGTYADSVAFAAAVRPPAHADRLFLATGGHNPRTWSGLIPSVLEWFSTLPGAAEGLPAAVAVAATAPVPWTPTRPARPTARPARVTVRARPAARTVAALSERLTVTGVLYRAMTARSHQVAVFPPALGATAFAVSPAAAAGSPRAVPSATGSSPATTAAGPRTGCGGSPGCGSTPPGGRGRTPVTMSPSCVSRIM